MTLAVPMSGHAYCWDVLGDPSFASRATDLCMTSVTLAAAYHSVRAATPLHPHHQLIDARYAALYRPVRSSAWRGRRLRPLAADWTDVADPYGVAAGAVRAAGLSVTAWVVLTHNSRLGTAFPDLAVVNCFGDRYPYALCPAQEEVRDYAATLAAEAVRDAPADAVSLESCGQMGLTHAGHHEKTEDAWDPPAQRWLSVCCCAACRRAWRAQGADPARIVAALRSAVRSGGPLAAAATVLAARHEAAASLRTQVVAAVRAEAPGIAIVLHANPDPWATGPSPGFSDYAGTVLVPAWPVTADSVRAVADAAAPGRRVHAYVTALPPTRPGQLADHVGSLVAAGASGINVYHLGLASPHRLRELRQVSTMSEVP